MDGKNIKREYEKQQTEKGQRALQVKKELASKMERIVQSKLQVGEIRPLINARTGQVMQYYIAG
ncbi:MAG TPA: hypothetical protein H9959_10440 [Candidatus Mediterraneibacter ornithocaccae]|nr:hypothetical protein [Candidatus Mediterraneibacter ornithocaccae]